MPIVNCLPAEALAKEGLLTYRIEPSSLAAWRRLSFLIAMTITYTVRIDMRVRISIKNLFHLLERINISFVYTIQSNSFELFYSRPSGVKLSSGAWNAF